MSNFNILNMNKLPYLDIKDEQVFDNNNLMAYR